MRSLGLGCILQRFVLSVLFLGAVQTLAQVSVTTQHNDNARDGQNTSETVLTPSNVNVDDFGLLAVVPTNGQAYAQPLILSNVSIAGGTHTVLYVADEGDVVAAYDATTGAPYWQTSLLPSGSTTVSNNCGNISPQYGVTATPVIDTSNGTIYVVGYTNDGGTIRFRLHALNVATGTEKFGGPVIIQASVSGNAAGNNSGVLTFDAQQQLQRPGLLLDNGHIILGFGSHCDFTPYYGWVMSYNASTLAQEAVFNTEANAGSANQAGGVWMSGGGMAADASGNIYFVTGNSITTGCTEDGTGAYGDSVVKLPLPVSGKSWTPTSFFTPADQQHLTVGDLDLGSGGLTLLPQLPSGKTDPNRLILAGKDGVIRVLNQASLGGYSGNCAGTAGSDNAIQEIHGQLGGVWGYPSYWNGSIYYGSAGDPLKAFSFNTTTGEVSTTAVDESTASFGSCSLCGASINTSVSSSGTADGIVWGIDGTNGVLHSFNASSLSELYNSTQNSSRDELAGGGGGVHFAAPTVANGKVYVGANNWVGIYGTSASARTWSGQTTLNYTGNCGALTISVTLTAAIQQSSANSTSWTLTLTNSNPSHVLTSGATWQIADSQGIVTLQGDSTSRWPVADLSTNYPNLLVTVRATVLETGTSKYNCEWTGQTTLQGK